MESIQTFTGLVLSGLVMAGSILLPILLLIFVVRVIRNSVTPQQREIQRLLTEAVELLKENNRLLGERSAGSSSKLPSDERSHQ